MAKAKSKAATASKSQRVADSVGLAGLMGKFKDRLKALAASVVDSIHTEEKATGTQQAEFAALCLEVGVPTIEKDGAVLFDKESEKGKAVAELFRDLCTDRCRESSHYDIPVHRVSQDADEYRPVQMWSSRQRKFVPIPDAPAANFTFSAKLALGAKLAELPNTVESPFGQRAWLRVPRGGVRPDGYSIGLRDRVKNTPDKAVSRMFATDQNRAVGAKATLPDRLDGVYKFLKGAHGRWLADENAACTDAVLKQACAKLKAEVLLKKK